MVRRNPISALVSYVGPDTLTYTPWRILAGKLQTRSSQKQFSEKHQVKTELQVPSRCERAARNNTQRDEANMRMFDRRIEARASVRELHSEHHRIEHTTPPQRMDSCHTSASTRVCVPHNPRSTPAYPSSGSSSAAVRASFWSASL